jgi:glycosyltransferase involved in cell wall biosynthesis
MNILLITAYFPPEVGSAAHLFHDLGIEFVNRGHRVTVLTGYPAYNVDQASLPEKYRTGKRMVETVHGMTVVRVRSPRMPRHVPVLRGVEQVLMAFRFALAGIFHVPERSDVVLVYSPPLFLGLSALAIRWFRRPKVIVNIQDLFPQSAVDLGVLKNGILIRLFRRIESRIYQNADRITVHSEGNRQHVIRCGGDAGRTSDVPNPVDTRAIVPGPRNNAFRASLSVADDELVFSFAGVIGLSQDLDTVIDAAHLLQGSVRAVFYIVGDGIEKARLTEKARGLTNVRFLPMLPIDQYVSLLHASDVCLVTLHQEVKTPVVPSKILSIMAAGRPILASLPLAGDAPRIIDDARCGVCIGPNDPQAFADAVRRMCGNRAQFAAMGESGRAYVVGHFSMEQCATVYEELFKSVTT